MRNLKYPYLFQNALLKFPAIAIAFVIFVYADARGEEKCDSALCSTVYFRKSSNRIDPGFRSNARAIDSVRYFLQSAADMSPVEVEIHGSASPEGNQGYNRRLAQRRADNLFDYFGKVLDSLTETKNSYGDIAPRINPSRYPSQRYASITLRVRRQSADTLTAAVADSVSTADTVSEDTVSQAASTNMPLSADTSDNIAVTVSEPQRQSKNIPVFITTNMLYDAALTPNIGIGVSLSDRVTVQADWMYARWNNHDKRRYWRIYGGDIEVRYRIGPRRNGSPLGGHYVGAYGSIACYDFQAGRSHSGVLSDKYNYAAGLSYTYSLPVSTRFNIDFNLGVGYLWGTYKKHKPIDDCDVWMSTHKLGWFGPTRVGVTLVWLVGNGVANNKKGGNR